MYIFYHEFDSLSSGAAVLITNLAKGLLDSGKEVLLINYHDGHIHKELGKDHAGLTVVNRDVESIKNIANKLGLQDIIITTHFYTVYKHFLKANPRILFFCVNTTSLNEVNRLPLNLNFRGLTKKLITILKKRGGIVFGDEYALEQNAIQFDLNKNEFEIIPIPVIVPGQNQYLANHWLAEKETILTYVGRAIDWKIFPAKKILQDLIHENVTGRKVCFKIVTDNAKVFREALSLELPPGIRLEFYENLSQTELVDFLVKNADLHFAMGTAALDGARLGIPTILLDLAYRDFPAGYLYNFVYDTPPTFIGTDANHKKEHTGKSMKHLVELTVDKSDLQTISEKCFQYVKQHHNISAITPLIEKTCEDNKMMLSDARSGIVKFWF